ncbi:MAG: DegT/DnrJ/EryC1/StrS family aminotransferase [Armatimonadota bacterium]|nr:DegT/DnrJ/EryC1/StrS family aminotransferase [Armatimonadota bacterium]MDR7400680.1 DegT/DnrJ/EryC1/StrS family aminotransferase [Armatimonadota bacterium]MDR7403613.1 DegT/DnrJ/EryC1/StrS family aminotransferase [Armatimonadota bacterium]MDR7436509.1 DegT/DnrJ/EryC1/StrS family aminotransferase [Armatimonadota bacterium]MDR7472544.1 DegT/DnrJ/EryC1/StrS family aminotransferase [Armatimonadota bacterium]
MQPSSTRARTIPLARPLISEEDRRRVLEVLESGQLVAGRQVAEFEQAFARYLGVREAVATSSGTAALQVALQACGIGPGDVVVTTPFTFAATSNAVLHAGARPVFADVDACTGNLDPQAVEEAVRRHRARAILCVHLYGMPCEMDALVEVAARHGALLVEDCAQAHGARYRGRPVGTFGAAAIFSFYPSKNMTTGEGGMVVTDDPRVAARARLLVNVGQRPGHDYVYEEVGHNFRMTDIAAALGIGQLQHLDAWNARRREHARRYTAAFASLEWVVPPPEPPEVVPAYNTYTVRVPRDRPRLMDALRAAQIACRVYYPSLIPHSPAYRRLGLGGEFPAAERLTGEVLSLPVHPALEPDDVERVIAVVTGVRP